MTILYMEAVTSSLKRSGLIQGATGDLSTGTGATASEIFTSKSQIQHAVDLHLQIWQEGVQAIAEMNAAPPSISTATINFTAGSRTATLPSDFERVAGRDYQDRIVRPNQSATQGIYGLFTMPEYDGGLPKMRRDQGYATDQNGRPNYWAIDLTATAPRLVFDYASTATFSMLLDYEKTMALTSTMATQAMPFSDSVTTALVPVVSEYYERADKKQFDASAFRIAISRAAALAQRVPPKSRWGFSGG